MRKVVAVVGPLASGKGALLDLLKEKGYEILSLSSIVREKNREWGLRETRENLQDTGDNLRKKFGSSILAELISPIIQKNSDTNFAIDGVRNPAEVAFLKKKFNAFVIGVIASPEIRFDLIKKRKRAGDPRDWDEFKRLEERDRGIGQESFGQQVDASMKMADMVIDNNGTFQNFQDNLRYFLKNNF